MEKLIEIKDLSVAYDHEEVLKQVNLEIFDRDFVGIIGPNGGGKTTLVRALLGLIKPNSGKITFNISRSEIGYLPQINQVDRRFPIKVIDVVRSGKNDAKLWVSSAKAKESVAYATHLLEQMGIAHIKDKAIGELSGGQTQRVFLCRSLMNHPRVLILDEPDTFVDNQFESELYLKLKELNKGMAILLISHDLGTITYYVKTIACVNKTLHYHPDNLITEEQLADYNCPIQIVTHGRIPHRVLGQHKN